jgi:membrane protein
LIKLQRIILTSAPVAYVIRKSKEISLPGFEGLPVFDVVSFFAKQMQQVGLNERAAAISFNFLMAIPPLAIVLFTTLSHLPMSETLYNEALILARQITPDDSTYNMIKSVMNDFFNPDGGLISMGLTLPCISLQCCDAIMRTFNKSMLHIEVEKNFLQIRYEAIKLTILIIILIIATILSCFQEWYLLMRNWLSIGDRSITDQN